MDSFAVSTAVLNVDVAVLKAANFLSTSAFSATVVLPSAMALLIEPANADIEERRPALAFDRDTLAEPSR